MQVDLFTGESIIEKAIMRLREYEPEEGYHLAFSGGKDSQAIHRLAEMSGVKFDAHYRVCPDAPELLRFIREEYPDVEWHRDKRGFFRRMERRSMPPTRQVRYCCDHKENSGDGRFIITGIRWAESSKRSKRRMVEQCNRNKTKKYMNVIIDWTDEDVWWFLRKYVGKWCKLYDEGWKRLGCIGCPMSSNRVKEFERWPKYRDAWWRAIEAMFYSRIERRGPYPDITTPEELWDWWMGDLTFEDGEQECFRMTDN